MARVAFLFPGQGAQHVGMGRDFAEAYPASARVFEEARRILGWDVAKVCFEGPKEKLDRTDICQPAILTTSMAVLAAMEEAGAQEVRACTAAAGLSLGEYTALVMADALEFASALRLVEKRGRFMQEACERNPGAMAGIIGLEDGIVEAICAQVREKTMVIAANYNSPGQVVVSGTPEGVRRVGELAKQKGAKRVIPLAVSGAFHSPLMGEAADRLRDELENVSFAPCSMTVISNVSAEPVTDPDEIRSALARQVKSPVRWAQSMRRLIDEDYRTFVEVGPGKVLTGLMRRIDPGVEVKNISSVESLKALVEE